MLQEQTCETMHRTLDNSQSWINARFDVTKHGLNKFDLEIMALEHPVKGPLTVPRSLTNTCFNHVSRQAYGSTSLAHAPCQHVRFITSYGIAQEKFTLERCPVYTLALQKKSAIEDVLDESGHLSTAVIWSVVSSPSHLIASLLK